MGDKSTKGKSKLLKGGRTGKQFGGPLARPLAQPGVAPVRPLGFKGGTRVKKVHGRTVRPLARPFGLKGGKTAKAGGGYVYNKKK